MKFYTNVIRSFVDLPNHISMIFHSLEGCPFHCFGCHNYESLVANAPKEHLNNEQVLEHIERNGFLFEAIIFSGGEFLISPLSEIKEFIVEVRKVFDGKIIINSNAIYPNKVKALLNEGIVDGVHCDMKLPYHLLEKDIDDELVKTILGLDYSQTLIDKMLETIDFIIQHNSEYSQIRTTKYPILDDVFFDEIEKYVENKNKEFGSNVKYYLNNFIEV